MFFFFFFFFNDTATTEIYTRKDTLSLHDALPISPGYAAAPAPGSAQDRRHRGRIGRERVRGLGHQLPGGGPRGGAAAIERRGGAAQAHPARHLQHRRRAHHSARPHALHLPPDRGARRVDPATGRGGFLARDHRARPGGSAIAGRAARLAAATPRRAGGGEKPLSAPPVARAEDAADRAARTRRAAERPGGRPAGAAAAPSRRHH